MKLSHGLAEGEEGVSEDVLGKRKKYDLDRVVHSQSETIDRMGKGLRRSGRSVVSVRSTAPREVKVEISGARVVGINREAFHIPPKQGSVGSQIRFRFLSGFLYSPSPVQQSRTWFSPRSEEV